MYLCKPTRETLSSWKGLLAGDIPDYLRDIKKALDEIDLDSEKELEDLLWDYTRLFIGPYKLPCPPWESVYTSAKQLMMQDAYTEVGRLYEEAGLAMSDSAVMADHIGAELNFLAVMLQRTESGGEAESLSNITSKLINDHLMQWVPRFTSDMRNASDSSFFKSLATVTGDLIVSIADELISRI